MRVGTTDSETLWPEDGVAVDTGPAVGERMVRVRGCSRERELRMSRGPKMSRAWKPGNRAAAKRVGGAEADMVIW